MLLFFDNIFVLCYYNFHKEEMKKMREAVNEEYMKMLSEDYEYDLVNVKKCWILLTNIYDFIENDEMGAECLAKLVDYRRQNQDAEERKKIENLLEDSYECSGMNIFDCIPLFNDILRSVKDTYPMKTKIDEEKSKKLFYRMED